MPWVDFTPGVWGSRAADKQRLLQRIKGEIVMRSKIITGILVVCGGLFWQVMAFAACPSGYAELDFDEGPACICDDTGFLCMDGPAIGDTPGCS